MAFSGGLGWLLLYERSLSLTGRPVVDGLPVVDVSLAVMGCQVAVAAWLYASFVLEVTDRVCLSARFTPEWEGCSDSKDVLHQHRTIAA